MGGGGGRGWNKCVIAKDSEMVKIRKSENVESLTLNQSQIYRQYNDSIL